VTHYRVILVTAPLEEAKTIAKAIVEERLAACVNVVERVSSFYIWEGELQEDSEALLIIKTVGHNVDALEKRIKELHSYEVPEFITLQVQEGSEEYLAWIDEVTRR
jgi:periplasmic divalent cation tolerance protein